MTAYEQLRTLEQEYQAIARKVYGTLTAAELARLAELRKEKAVTSGEMRREAQQ